MIKVEDARKIIMENTDILPPETVNIINSLNRVLAEDIYSAENIPHFNNSAMDGYAVVAGMTKGASENVPAILQLTGNIPAGYTYKETVQGCLSVKIMTGAPIPAGADAVIPIEYAREEGSVVKILREAQKCENIRFEGEDIKKGQLVIPKGRVIRPAEIGMMAALNIDRVRVIKTPVVSILATGDELVDLGDELLPGKVRNINSYSLYAQVAWNGGEPVSLGIARDTKDAIKEKLKKAINSDIFIISGGVSVGDYDFVKKVLAEMGMQEKFWKIAMKPGKPVLFGVMGKTLVFGLPGNPVSSMVAFEQFVLPSIYKLQGKKQKPWKELNVILDEDITKKPGLVHFIRGKTFLKDGKVYVKHTGTQSSGVFSSMVQADCLIVISEETTEVKRGEEVLIQITGEIGE